MNRTMTRVGFAATMLITAAAFQPSMAGGFHDRRAQRLEESQNQNASAEELQKAKEVRVPAAFDQAWDAAVQVLKTKGITIDKAEKEIGQIKTEFQITNPKKPKQHGMRYILDFRKVSAAETGVRVAGLEQTRPYVFQPDPWGEPKYNAEASEALSDAIVEAAKAH